MLFLAISRVRIFQACLSACFLGSQVLPAHAESTERVPSEEDYFANVPVVLTASRLDQPLNEAPGAITLIDRNTIRLSGARTLNEVLRLVPGYLSGGFNGANPNAAYHIPLDDYGSRNLVLIDGRSVYSSMYLGDTHRGMQDVMLEDIERIEVLRGSNSAAYGANAMFGVINIITRHSGDTIGAELSTAAGNNGISDKRARLGVGNEKASFRLSVGEQQDNGYLNTFDSLKIGHVHGRADFKPSWMDDIMFSAGVTYEAGGDGFPGGPDNGNPQRTVHTHDVYANMQWRRQLSSTDELQVSANYMEDWRQDVVPFAAVPGIMLDSSGAGRRTNVEVQRKVSLASTVRAVLGVGYKEEAAQSRPLYATDDWRSFHEERLFSTAEWRVTPQWLINSGLFYGKQSLTGAYSAPRLMVNWLPSPEHTFRAGVTESVRAPSLFEYAGDVRFYLDGVWLAQTVGSTGQVRPERLKSQEIGYLGRFANRMLTVDARAYNERMDSVIWTTKHPQTNPDVAINKPVTDYANQQGFSIQGVEYQLRWKPFESTELWLNQNFEHLHWDDPDLANRHERQPPRYATTIALFQHLGPCQLSVIHQQLGSMTWRDDRDWMGASHRTDVRLAYPFKLGTAKAEAAFTVQRLEGDQPFFQPTTYHMEVGRKSFVSLKLEI